MWSLPWPARSCTPRTLLPTRVCPAPPPPPPRGALLARLLMMPCTAARCVVAGDPEVAEGAPTDHHCIWCRRGSSGPRLDDAGALAGAHPFTEAIMQQKQQAPFVVRALLHHYCARCPPPLPPQGARYRTCAGVGMESVLLVNPPCDRSLPYILEAADGYS